MPKIPSTYKTQYPLGYISPVTLNTYQNIQQLESSGPARISHDYNSNSLS